MSKGYSIKIQQVGLPENIYRAKVKIDAEDVYFFNIYDLHYRFPRADYDIHIKDIPSVPLIISVFNKIIGFDKYDSRLYKVQISNNNKKINFYMMENYPHKQEILSEHNIKLKTDDIVLNSDLYPIWPENKKAEIQKTLLNLHKQPKTR